MCPTLNYELFPEESASYYGVSGMLFLLCSEIQVQRAKENFAKWPSSSQLYTYRWDRQGRKGQTCKVTARGKFNSICVVFESDGYHMITSGNAIRKLVPPSRSAMNED